MKKEAETKKITIDKLAIMMNNSFEGLKKDIFGVKEELFGVKKELNDVKEEIKGVKNQLEGTNKRIDDLAMNRVKYEDHNKLKARVDFMEKNLK